MVTSSPILLSFFFAPASCLLRKQHAGTPLVTDVAGGGVNLKATLPTPDAKAALAKAKAVENAAIEKAAKAAESKKNKSLKEFEEELETLRKKETLDDSDAVRKESLERLETGIKSEYAKEVELARRQAAAFTVQAANQATHVNKHAAEVKKADLDIANRKKTDLDNGTKARADLNKFHTTEAAKRLKAVEENQKDMNKAAPKEGILPLKWETGKCFDAEQQRAKHRHYLQEATKNDCAKLCAEKISSGGTYRTYCQFDSEIDPLTKVGQCSYFTFTGDGGLVAGSQYKDDENYKNVLTGTQQREERENRRGFCAPVGFEGR